jgi:hypothetical protein
VLCNVWKAHIGAGISLTSFIIATTELKIVIPDFGSGIHPDIMGRLYGSCGGADTGEEPGQSRSSPDYDALHPYRLQWRAKRRAQWWLSQSLLD